MSDRIVISEFMDAPAVERLRARFDVDYRPKLVDDAADILDELRLPGLAGSAGEADLDAPAHPLLAHLAYDPCDIDTLASRAGLPVHEVSAALIELELGGAVASLAGGLWQRIS